MTGLEDDRSSGSLDVAGRFLQDLERWTFLARSPTAPALRGELLAWLRSAQAAQPTMALVHQLAARALAIADTAVVRGDTPGALRDSLVESCGVERTDLAAAVRGAADVAAQLVESNDAWIATLSTSGGVLGALFALHARGRRPRVLVAESRPRLEGRATAALLAAKGLLVWLVADAALPMLMQQAAALFIGADAVTEHGVVNKIGSYSAALAAREHGVPVWAIAVRRKLLPAATPALMIREMPPEELWDEPAAGVRPRNVYFELVPHALLRGVVVEDGVLGASEAAVSARDRELPAELAAALPAG